MGQRIDELALDTLFREACSYTKSQPRPVTDQTARDLFVVSDGCPADTDEGHANSLAVFKKWFGETPTVGEALTALNKRRRGQ